MNAGTAPAPKQLKSKELEKAEAELKSEAAAIDKLRVQLSTQGAAADKKQVAEFAKRQKAYLDRRIDFEKLKRSTDSGKPAPEKTKPAAPEPAKPAPEPVQKQKAQPPVPAPVQKQKVQPPPPAPVQKQKAQPPTPAPQKTAPPVREKVPLTESAKPQRPETSRAKAPVRAPEKSSARWIFWLLLAAAAGLIAWLMR